MLPRFLSFVSALSLLVCIASLVMWARSLRTQDILGLTLRDFEESSVRTINVITTAGEIHYGESTRIYRGLHAEEARFAYSWSAHPAATIRPEQWLPSTRRFAGFAYASQREVRQHSEDLHTLREVSSFRLAAPIRSVTLLSGVVPAIWLHCRRKHLKVRKRLAAGQCPSCGYDLRGSPDRRCPECGNNAIFLSDERPKPRTDGTE